MGNTGSPPAVLSWTFSIEFQHLFGINKELVCSDRRFAYLHPRNCPEDGTEPSHEDPDPEDFDYEDFKQSVDCRGTLQEGRVFRRFGAKITVCPVGGRVSTGYDSFSRWLLIPVKADKFIADARDVSRWMKGVIKDVVGWEFWGGNLISPALPVPEITSQGIQLNGVLEMETYFRIMRKELPPSVPYVFISHPESTTVRVHIDLERVRGREVPIPLNVVRHLAWICIAFEDVITLFHHPELHGYHGTWGWVSFQSNRTSFRNEYKDRTVHNCSKGGEFPLVDAFIKIFDNESFDYNGSRIQFANALKQRHGSQRESNIRRSLGVCKQFVGFLDRPHQTSIVFRQHNGTVSHEEIGEWILFLTAMVRAAERMANEPRCNAVLMPSVLTTIMTNIGEQYRSDMIIEQARKYANMFEEPRKLRTLGELFDLLELPVSRRRYWWERARNFQASRFAKYYKRSTCEHPGCKLPPVRDCKGYKKGELDEKPWDVEITGVSKVTSNPKTVPGPKPAPQPASQPASTPNIMSIDAILN